MVRKGSPVRARLRAWHCRAVSGLPQVRGQREQRTWGERGHATCPPVNTTSPVSTSMFLSTYAHLIEQARDRGERVGGGVDRGGASPAPEAGGDGMKLLRRFKPVWDQYRPDVNDRSYWSKARVIDVETGDAMPVAIAVDQLYSLVPGRHLRRRRPIRPAPRRISCSSPRRSWSGWLSMSLLPRLRPPDLPAEQRRGGGGQGRSRPTPAGG